MRHVPSSTPAEQSAAVHFVVVLCRPQGPINVGNVCRVCANLGVTDLRVVAPCCDIHEKAARMFAHHAQDRLNACSIQPTLPDAVADCDWVVGTTARRRRDRMECVAPHALRPTAVQRGARRVALVFGNESDGLNRDELRVCDASLHLQTPGPYASYNLSHAVAIALYLAVCPPECRDETQAPSPVSPARASHLQIQRLYEYWLGTLERAGYFRRTQAARFAPKLQRLLQRWAPGEHDVHTLWGMLAQINSRLTNPSESEQAPLGQDGQAFATGEQRRAAKQATLRVETTMIKR